MELLNGAGRSARPSNPAFAAAGQAPSPAGELHVASGREGATLTWQPQPGPGLMELHRTLVSQAAPPTSSTKQAARAKNGPTPGNKPDATGPELLRPESAAALAKDPGGMIDPGVHPGDTVTYIAGRVHVLELDGHTLELHGEPSAPLTFTARDVFPPRPPTRLSSVGSPALGANGPEIDLSWQPSPDADLRGYYVYRSAAGEPFRRLTPKLAEGPAFRDLDVKPGVRYRYRVTAVDETGNESSPSAVVEDKVPPV